MTHIHQTKAGDGLLLLGPPSCPQRPRCTSRIHKELALKLIRFKLVCTSPQQNINIHMPRCNQQAVRIARRYNRMPMCETDTQGAVRHDFGEGEVGCLDVKVSFDDL